MREVWDSDPAAKDESRRLTALLEGGEQMGVTMIAPGVGFVSDKIVGWEMREITTTAVSDSGPPTAGIGDRLPCGEGGVTR